MKDLKQIAKELEAVLPSGTNVYNSPDPYWSVYTALSGHFEGKYFDVGFYQRKGHQPDAIEISFNTENRMLFKKMLKKIEPKCNILNKER
jgi:hypothetical protein